MTYQIIEVRPLSGSLGAEVSGADLKAPDSSPMWQELRRAFLAHRVLAILDQDLAPADLMRVGYQFGEPCHYPFAKGLFGYEFITDVIKAAHDRRSFGEDWHIDSVYLPAPPSTTLLYALEVPPYGGDTLFANTADAYDALSEGMKKMLSGLRWFASASLKNRKGGARETYLSGFGSMSVQNSQGAAALEALHPVVRRHPQTGRDALYLSPIHTLRFDGLTEAESRPLLDFLCEHCLTPEFTCRVGWVPGQLTVWDNRTTLHKAINDYDGHHRHMRRLTVGAETPQ